MPFIAHNDMEPPNYSLYSQNLWTSDLLLFGDVKRQPMAYSVASASELPSFLFIVEGIPREKSNAVVDE
jgi:hypothetical protein